MSTPSSSSGQLTASLESTSVIDDEHEPIQKINSLFRKCLKLHRSAFPASSIDIELLNLTARVLQARYPVGRGHFSDVFQGELDKRLRVAVKVLRLPLYSSRQERTYESALLHFFSELSHWNQLNHLNIARMLGFTFVRGNLGFVSLWYSYGDLVQYMESNPDASKADLMLDIAEGLLYLHTASPPLIHADLKGTNIFINDNGIACLGDFGISKQLNQRSSLTTTGLAQGTTPWMAPELFDDEATVTLASDIYAYAGVILEIACPGKTPFHYVVNEIKLIMAKVNGELPDRSQYPELDKQDSLWNFMARCWGVDRSERPEIQEVIKILYNDFGLGPRVIESVANRPVIAEKFGDRRMVVHSNSVKTQSIVPVQDDTMLEAKTTHEADIRKHRYILDLTIATEQFLQQLEVIDSLAQTIQSQRPPIIPAYRVESFVHDTFGGVLLFRDTLKKLLRDLYIRHREHGSVIWKIGDVLLGSAEELANTYPNYSEGSSAAQERLAAEVQSNWAFRTLLTEKFSASIPASDVVKIPTAYFATFCDILQRIIEETDSNHPDFDEAKQTLALLRWGIGSGNLVLWQNAGMAKEPESRWEWEDQVYQHQNIPEIEVERQRLMFQMIQKEMCYVREFNKCMTEHSSWDALSTLYKTIFPQFNDLYDDHQIMVLRLQSIQRNDYPVIRSVMSTLLEASLNWQALYEGYFRHHPRAWYELFLRLQNSQEPWVIVEFDIDFAALALPRLHWYTEGFLPALEKVTLPGSEDLPLIHQTKDMLCKILAHLQPTLTWSVQRQDLFRFIAGLEKDSSTKRFIEAYDPLNENRKHVISIKIHCQVGNTVAWYSGKLTLLDNVVALDAVVDAKEGWDSKCVQAIPLQELAEGAQGGWTRACDRRYLYGMYRLMVHNATNRVVGVEHEDTWTIWSKKLDEVIKLHLAPSMTEGEGPPPGDNVIVAQQQVESSSESSSGDEMDAMYYSLSDGD